MSKLKWCLGIKNGIEVREPNTNLAEAYIQKAESALESMNLVKNQDWIIATAYYSMYFSIYAILTKIGIKCENHTCSIEFIKEMMLQDYNEEEIEFLEKSMRARVDKQYYTDRVVADEQSNEMMRRAPEFLVKSKEVILKLTEKEIKKIRVNIMKINNEKKGEKT